MFQIHFNRVLLTHSARYLFLISTPQDNKRTNITQHITSSPEFSPLLIDDLNDIQIKLCEAGTDKKLRIVGLSQVRRSEMNEEGSVVYEGEKKLQQKIEGKNVCVGLCHITIAKVKTYTEEKPKPIKNSQLKQSNVQASQQAQDEFSEQQQEDLQNDENIRMEVHYGTNFYIGSSFRVQMQWGKTALSTKLVRDNINPTWSQSLSCQGPSAKPLVIRVLDQRENILEHVRIQIDSLRILYPYHIKMIFKEEYHSVFPQVYLTVIRQSLPMYSVTQNSISYSIKSIGEPLKNNIYFSLSLKQTSIFPYFIQIDKRKLIEPQDVNKLISKQGILEQNRIDLIGLSHMTSTNSSNRHFSILKSYLNRKMYLNVFSISDMKKCFGESNQKYCTLLQKRADFQIILRKIYYQGDSFTLKKYFQLFNPAYNLTTTSQEESDAQKWKLLSTNYALRHQLVTKSAHNISHLRKEIEEKGRQLVTFKKCLKQVKVINEALIQKEKLMQVTKVKKVRLNAKSMNFDDLVQSLVQKLTILQGQKRINSQLAARMESLVQVEEDQRELNDALVKNSTKILQQQAKIDRMNKMKANIKKQRLIIGQLQKIFQQREVDKRVNEALTIQENRLKQMRQRKEEGLKDIYNLVKDRNKSGNSLRSKIKQAEQKLIKLNEQYARNSAY